MGASAAETPQDSHNTISNPAISKDIDSESSSTGLNSSNSITAAQPVIIQDIVHTPTIIVNGERMT